MAREGEEGRGPIGKLIRFCFPCSASRRACDKEIIFSACVHEACSCTPWSILMQDRGEARKTQTQTRFVVLSYAPYVCVLPAALQQRWLRLRRRGLLRSAATCSYLRLGEASSQRECVGWCVWGVNIFSPTTRGKQVRGGRCWERGRDGSCCAPNQIQRDCRHAFVDDNAEDRWRYVQQPGWLLAYNNFQRHNRKVSHAFFLSWKMESQKEVAWGGLGKEEEVI